MGSTDVRQLLFMGKPLYNIDITLKVEFSFKNMFAKIIFYYGSKK